MAILRDLTQYDMKKDTICNRKNVKRLYFMFVRKENLTIIYKKYIDKVHKKKLRFCVSV